MASAAGSSTVPEKRARRSRPTSSSASSEDPVERLRVMVDNGKVPSHVKLVIDLLMQTRDEAKETSRRNGELLQETNRLREENSELKQKLSHLESRSNVKTPKTSNVNSDSGSWNEDIEIKRSIIIANVSESEASNASARVAHDFDCFEFTGFSRHRMCPDRLLSHGQTTAE